MFVIKHLALVPSLIFFSQLSEGSAKPDSWWKTIQQDYEGDDLRKCSNLKVAPKSGKSCSKGSGTCFFGDQQCDGKPYPIETCTCENYVWTCSAVLCPGTENGVAGACPLVINNPAACPNDNPLFTADLCQSASLIGQTCHYGEESW